MSRFFRVLAAVACHVFIFGCTTTSDAFTLYRNSVLDLKLRIHVGTFDTSDGADCNAENCEVAAHLFQNQDGVKVRYWCEKGSFRK